MSGEFDAWIAQLPSTPFYETWSGALTVIGASAFLLLVSVAAKIANERIAVAAADRQRENLSEAKLRGPLGRWKRVLDWSKDHGHVRAPGSLAEVIRASYDRWFVLIAYLRTAATLVGLLFTFLGLALTLTQLNTALAPASGDAIDLEQILKHVRAAMPGLGTAFASSICGVLLSILIGLGEAILDAFAGSTIARTTAFAEEVLEPVVLPATDLGALSVELSKFVVSLGGIVDELGGISKGAGEIKTTVVAVGAAMSALKGEVRETRGKVDDVLDALQNSATSLQTFGARVEDLPSKVNEAVDSAVETIDEHHRENLRMTTDAADKQRLAFQTAVAGSVGELVAAATAQREAGEATAAQMLQAAVTCSEEVAASVKRVEDERRLSTKALAGLVASLTAAGARFENMATQVGDSLDRHREAHETLARTYAGFTTAAGRIEVAVAQQSQVGRQVAEVIENELTPSVHELNNATASSQQASTRLREVVDSERLESHLDNMKRLTDVFAAEQTAFESLQQAATAMVGVPEAVRSLDSHVAGVGHTTDLVRRTLEEVSKLATSIEQTAATQLIPQIDTLVRKTTQATVGATDERWNERMDQYHETTGDLLESIEKSSKKLARAQEQLTRWFGMPVWRRILGREDT